MIKIQTSDIKREKLYRSNMKTFWEKYVTPIFILFMLFVAGWALFG